MSSGEGPVAFLDRDGTINRKAPEDEYVARPEDLVVLPGAAQAIRLLRDAGLRVVVVTNQRGVARGRMTEADLAAVHRRLVDELEREGAGVDAILHCPHEEGACDCRKPRPGLFLRAAEELGGVRFEESFMVGDAPSDVQAGVGLGMCTIALALSDAEAPAGADHVAPSLLEAARWIVRRVDERP